MTRPRSHSLKIQRKLSLPATLVATIDQVLMDPLYRKRQYGAFSLLVEQLLVRWIDENHIRLNSEPIDLRGARTEQQDTQA